MHIKSDEARQLLGVSRNQLYRLVSIGKIPAYKPTGRLLFNRSELMAYIENSKVQPKGKPVNITVRRRQARNSGLVYRGEKKWVG